MLPSQEAEAQARADLEAIMADSSQTEEVRKRAKDALRKQHEEMQVCVCVEGVCVCRGDASLRFSAVL